MVTEGGPARKVLVVNPAAGAVSDGDLERLRKAFPDALLLTVSGGEDFHALLSDSAIAEDALVIVVGGDGTVGAVARALAGTRHPFGIVPRGTFNNFARSLEIPLDFDEALAAIELGRPRSVTFGKVNGRPFLEAAAIGLFGEAIALGEASKDFHYGDIVEHLSGLASSRPFRYRLSGDSKRRGEAKSLVVANTPFTGARLDIGEHRPTEPYLELTIGVGKSRIDVLRRLLRGLLRRPRPESSRNEKVRRIRVETSPRMRVYADVSEAGETPVEIEAVTGGLTVIR
jgi:diacylglycerol kinase family enzyme